MSSLEQYAFTGALVVYTLCAVLYWWYVSGHREIAGRLAVGATVAGWLFHSGAVAARAILAGRAPLANGYEFLLSFTWSVILLLLIFIYRTHYKTLGAFVLPVTWVLLAYMAAVLPGTQKSVAPLMPALKSNWLTIHVATAATAYGAFALACGLALIYLWHRRSSHPGDDWLDYLTYRMVALGFLMLSLAIVTGAIWAEQAWSSYWSWDPKETWSLVTWLVYGAYLHARVARGWRGRPAAILAVIGFGVTLFTFFGVNYWLSGLHSYA